MQLTAPLQHPFAHGPATNSAATLTTWLEQQREATVRLPVLVTLGPARSTVAAAQLLTTAKDPVPLSLDDSALGISLADRARSACPGAERCPLWLEGTSRSAGLFVTRVVRAVTAGEGLFAQVEVADARPDLAALLEVLGTDAPIAEKREAARALRAAGRDAVALLLAALGDERPYEVRDIANRMNLPLGANPAPLLSTMTVGARCEDLLHELVTPAVEVLPGQNFKVFSEQVLRIDDWQAFWARRRDRTLEQIHTELAPLVREYWKAHGTTQTVP